MKIARDSSASVWLDLIRGAAAVAVLIYHVRYRFFLDYADLTESGLTAKLFYAATAFGHDAVIVFFVLSGFFISRSVIQGFQGTKTGWKSYSLSRLTRLYVVLLPALLITLVCDGIGLFAFPEHPIYTGQPQTWIHDYFSVGARLAPEVLTGNLVFLQMVFVPPAGSNEALWSLAYEFWYYMIFPCIFVCLTATHSIGTRLLHGILAVCIGFLVGHQILLYLPIWLMGTAVCLAPTSAFLFTYRRSAILLSAALFICLTLVGHGNFLSFLPGKSIVWPDYLTAIGFTFLLYLLCHCNEAAAPSVFQKFATTVSGFSYTLYAVHLPILVLLRASLVPYRPWSPNLTTICSAMLISVMVIGVAYLLSLVTEGKTASVRVAVLRCFGG